MSLKKVMSEKASPGMLIISDVDGVHTPRAGGVISCEPFPGRVAFTLESGLEIIRMIPDAESLKNLEVVIGGFPKRPVWELYRFYTPDGQAIQNLLKAGNGIEIVSGREAAPVADRFGCTLKYADGDKMFRPGVSLGVKDKLLWAYENNFDLSKTVFIGDGAQDAELMAAVKDAGGIAVATADAEEEAILAADAQTVALGGEGAFAELARLYLEAVDGK